MLSLRECIHRKITPIRRDPWAPDGRLSLEFNEDGTVLPFGTAEDIATDTKSIPPQAVFLMHLDWDEEVWEAWEAWERAASSNHGSTTPPQADR